MDYELILGNSNRKFSGVTSTMLQTLNCQHKKINLCVLGKSFVPEEIKVVGMVEAKEILDRPLVSGKCRVFHARRNDEMIQALILKRLSKTPFKIVFTSTAQRYHSRFTKFLMSKMDAVISTCSAAAGYLEHKPKAIIAHGVDTVTFKPLSNKEQKGDFIRSLGVEGQYFIGILGRVREQKGVDLFVEAALAVLPNHPEFTAVIVGSEKGNESFIQQLKSKISEHGLEKRVVFLGEQPFSNLPRIFASLSVVTALSVNEGFGLTVLEAMSSGTPVIATKAGAWEDIVSPAVDGYIIPVGDVSRLINYLGEMLSSPDRLLDMGYRGREKVLSHYTVDREAQQLLDFYRSLQ